MSRSPPINSDCVVQFKRNLLGGVTSLPVSPTSLGLNGAEVAVSGKLIEFNAEWVVLDASDRTLWVPRENVLLLQFKHPESAGR
jgi:hypothetical protein